MEDTAAGTVSKNWTIDSNICGRKSFIILNNGVQRKKNKGIPPCYFKSSKRQDQKWEIHVSVVWTQKKNYKYEIFLIHTRLLTLIFHCKNFSATVLVFCNWKAWLTCSRMWWIWEKKALSRNKGEAFFFFFFKSKRMWQTGRKWFIAADTWNC